MIWTIAFWQGAGERAIKTFFQVLASLVAIDSTGIGASVGLADIPWMAVLSVATMAALVSIFTSIANADFVAGVQDELPAKANLTGQVVELGGDEYVLTKADTKVAGGFQA